MSWTFLNQTDVQSHLAVLNISQNHLVLSKIEQLRNGKSEAQVSKNMKQEIIININIVGKVKEMFTRVI